MKDFIRNNQFLFFLIFLLLGIAYPIFSKNPRIMELISTLNYTLILISGLYAFSGKLYFLRYASIFFMLTILVEWLQYFFADTIYDKIQPLTTSVVLLMLLVMTLRSIAAAKVISANVIYGVVSGYILIGFIGGLLALLIEVIYPGAFSIAEQFQAAEAIYFSFVTMTTLGYGDISPTIQESRALAIILSIIGPMYVAIILSMIVGKFASGTGKTE
jgi:voltage-gated potassium channel Kch